MTFALLANELLLEVFEYFNTIHLFRAFYNLNSRIDALLLCYFQDYHLDFQSISKRNFDVICNQQLPFIINQIISLRLTDNDETPTLPNLFLSYGFTLDQFTRLKSLTLNHIYSFDIVNQLIIQCQSLPYLIHLSLIQCCLYTKDKNTASLINHIWCLRKLINCNLSNNFQDPNLLSTIQTNSISIQNLSLDSIPCDLNDLFNLFQYTPYLQRLRTTMSPSYQNQSFEIVISSIISLKIFHVNSISFLMIIQQMPNLRYLTMESTNICLNGHEWETIILDYLPNIQLFRLKMKFIFPNQNYIEHQIDQLIQTFQTTFWLEKYQWFVRCHCTGQRNDIKIGVLYTLPYTFEEFHLMNAEYYHKSTCPNEDDYLSYNHVRNLHIGNDYHEHFSQLNIRLPNIRYLSINLPCDNRLWSCISSFNRLISLAIRISCADSQYSQLRLLSEQINCLESLKLEGFNDLNNAYISFFLSKITSIHRLDILDNPCHNNEACVILANSSLGRQCEVLLIEVENRADVLYLINTMSQLRILIFRCEYIRWNDADIAIPLKNNELFTWLQHRLPSMCLFTRDSHLASSYMRVWIG